MSASATAARRRGPFLLLTSGLAVAALALMLYPALRPAGQARPSHPATAAPRADGQPSAEADPSRLLALRERAWQRAQPQIQLTHLAAGKEAEGSLAIVQCFLSERRQGVPRFAADVLSLRGKWKLLHSRLPYSDRDEHMRFLRESFERNVFTADELRSVLESAVVGYLDSTRGLENQLLVHLRADLEGLPATALPAAGSDRAFQEEFSRLAVEVERRLAGDLHVQVGREVASLVTGELAAVLAREVLRAAAARLGVSGGLLAGGAASSWATFGAGLVAAIVVDIGLDWAIHRAGYNPEGEIAAKVNGTLDRLGGLLLDGDREAIEVRAQLAAMAEGDSSAEVRAVAAAAAGRIGLRGDLLGLRGELARLEDARAQARTEALRQLYGVAQAPAVALGKNPAEGTP